MNAPTQRFSSRVENYIKYRPSYPPALIDTLETDCQLTASSVIADIGSGTGILSELFLKHGNPVFGVEPNAEMRAAGEHLLSGYANFVSVEGTAEATTLADHSVDFVTAGQAFHWFDQVKARQEFARILRAAGWVVLVWNYRRNEATPLMAAVEAILQTYSTDYNRVSHQRPEFDDQLIRSFFGPQGCRLAVYPNQQTFDFAGLQGRLLSASYTPEAGDPRYEPMLQALKVAFDMNQVDGCVTFEYETRMYYGRSAGSVGQCDSVLSY